MRANAVFVDVAFSCLIESVVGHIGYLIFFCCCFPLCRKESLDTKKGDKSDGEKKAKDAKVTHLCTHLHDTCYATLGPLRKRKVGLKIL